MSDYIIRSKYFIGTYACTWVDQINVNIIYNLLTKKCPKWKFVVVKEGPDEKVKHDHFHFWVFWDQNNRKMTIKNIEIPLSKPIISFFNIINGDNERIMVYQDLEENINNPDEIKEEYNCDGYETLTSAHPNIKPMFRSDSQKDMLQYLLKKPIEIKSNFDYEKYLNEDDTHPKKNKTQQCLEEMEELIKNGYGPNYILKEIKKKYFNIYMHNWSKWEGPFYSCFNKDTEFKINLDAEYYLPIEVYNWYIKYYLPFYEHMNDEEWLSYHRLDRPKSLVIIGKSQTGKTSCMRSLFKGNYYQFLIDGFNSWNSDEPCVILDDFNSDIKKFLPTWKCWLGSQTDFTVNPKYGRRRKVSWGHPCIFLNNEDIRTVVNDKGHSVWTEAEKDYLNKNCIFINSGDQKWFEQPNGLFKKVKVRDLRPDLVAEMESNDINVEEGRLPNSLGKHQHDDEDQQIQKKSKNN